MCNTNSRNNETEIGRKINMYYVKKRKEQWAYDSPKHYVFINVYYLMRNLYY